jgi:peptide/nickel transport system substrate-binding protein
LGAAAAALAAPKTVAAQNARELRHIPHADVAILDPVWTTADITRNHGNMVYDQLFGLDEGYAPHPQMLAGFTTSADGLTWDLTLRDGLKFHDGEKVLARDCAQSIDRWSKRDPFGTALGARANEIAAVSDSVLRIRLKTPFALLPEALAQPACVMMPQRLAQTDPNKQVTDPTGSGPFKFLADERVSGSRVAYAKNAAYAPREGGKASFLAGPRVAHFDRVVWTYQADAATAAAALAKGEHDWWELPTNDLVPLLKRDKNITVEVKNTMGSVGCLRFNHLFPPFDNPKIRQLVLSAIDQRDCMEAVSSPDYYALTQGLFTRGMPMANDAGTEALTARKDFAQLKKDLYAAGYKGEKIVLMGPTTIPVLHFQSQVVDDLLRKMGFEVDYQALEWGTVVQRRASKEPPEKGGWHIFITNLTSLTNVFLPAHIGIRSGPAAWFGWPDAPKLEELRDAWLNASNAEEQKAIARKLQVQMFEDVPYVPLGGFFAPAAHLKSVADIQKGWPVFHAARRV